ncbi:5-amino-6-(5-phosphoribosylamino)uracil reductase [Pseudonocardia thermophila]|uniref:5-amino-6-(5-phosphoribosylamino)uracil reductase n=1 Tax=Pseudonocardia thermophila TaxID=1848 RepID=A0A1M6ZBK0_PSETH|nr:dihydrofolate reductase family protein [Pseudonocardia thermophila]SHL27810.1 5-amino-6-(5-phosphoribosylamino)uracil reductase [Pseudonocardia thermophila]
MARRPFVLLSVAISLDGAIDDASPTRLILSDDADLDRVDAERAGVDAILVGAGTLRRDDPRLVLRDRSRGRDPVKVVLSGSGELDPDARFFTTGDAARLVYTSRPDVAMERLGGAATIVDAGDPLDLGVVLADLHGRGVERLMVEGGAQVHRLVLTADVVDELQVVVAPLVVGDPTAPRFGGLRTEVQRLDLRLAEARPMGDLVLLRYVRDGQR